VDAYNRTALHIAAELGNNDIVENLSNSAATVDALDADKWIALHITTSCNFKDLVSTLLFYDADINAQTGGGSTPLYIALEKGSHIILDCVMLSNISYQYLALFVHTL
jgi:ankyrin repeat protein